MGSYLRPGTIQEALAELAAGPRILLAGGLAEGAPAVQDDKPGNILTRGNLVKGDPDKALAEAVYTAEARMETGFVEHAYIEPEAGWARRVGDRLEMFVTTQAPYMDLEETSNILGIGLDQVRIIPSACGGGFGAGWISRCSRCWRSPHGSPASLCVAPTAARNPWPRPPSGIPRGCGRRRPATPGGG